MMKPDLQFTCAGGPFDGQTFGPFPAKMFNPEDVLRRGVFTLDIPRRQRQGVVHAAARYAITWEEVGSRKSEVGSAEGKYLARHLPSPADRYYPPEDDNPTPEGRAPARSPSDPDPATRADEEPEPEPPRSPMILMHFVYEGGPMHGMICGPVHWPESYLTAESTLCKEATQAGRFEAHYRIRPNPVPTPADSTTPPLHPSAELTQDGQTPEGSEAISPGLPEASGAPGGTSPTASTPSVPSASEHQIPPTVTTPWYPQTATYVPPSEIPLPTSS